MGIHLRAMERHLPYAITQGYLPPETCKTCLPRPQPIWLVLNLHTLERENAEFTWVVVGHINRCFICMQSVTHTSNVTQEKQVLCKNMY